MVTKYTISGKIPKELYKDTIKILSDKYMIDKEYMDNDTKLNILEYIMI